MHRSYQTRARHVAWRAAVAAVAAVAVYLYLAAPTLGAQATGGDSAPKKPFTPSALFRSDSILTLTLVADFPAIFAKRDTLDPKRFPGVVRVTGVGNEKSIPVELHTRGHFRLRRDQCNFPPLRVVFDKGTKQTVFDDQGGLKLITHCANDSKDHEQYVLREYLAYRAHALVTPNSFRARLVRIRYVPSRDTSKAIERYAFFLESEKEMAKRNGGKLLEVKHARYADLADSAMGLSMWEYFVGNTDWSLSALHNVRLVERGAAEVTAVPYDFDFSGFVETRYATPDARLPIRRVRDRLWRGPCPTPEAVRLAAEPFLAQRAALEQLPRLLPDIDGGWAGSTQQYIRNFFEELMNPSRFASTARSARPGCPPSN